MGMAIKRQTKIAHPHNIRNVCIVYTQDSIHIEFIMTDSVRKRKNNKIKSKLKCAERKYHACKRNFSQNTFNDTYSMAIYEDSKQHNMNIHVCLLVCTRELHMTR